VQTRHQEISMSSAQQPSWLKSYHVVIAIMGSLILLISNGMALSGLTPFRLEFIAKFGWTMQQMTLGDLISFGVVGVLAPLLGAVMDRVGVKKLMMLGGVVLALAYYSYGQVTTIAGTYGVHVLLGVGIALSGLVPTSRLIGRWFALKRGSAMGIALAGSSLAAYVFYPLAVKFIAAHGTTGAFNRLSMAGLVLTVLVALFVLDAPEEKGLSCYGEAPVSGDLPGLEFQAALKTTAFWCLALGAGMTFFSMLGTLFNLPQHMGDLGFDRATSGNGLKLMLTAALVGKFAFGFLSDYAKPKAVYMGNLAVMALGALLMARADADSVWSALIVFGLGWGGLYTMLQLLAVESFGMRAAGKIMGTIAVFDAFGGGLGSFVMGVIRTQYGSYQAGFYLMFGLIIVAALAATQVRQMLPNANMAGAQNAR
jgi:sugar phosphate permease